MVNQAENNNKKDENNEATIDNSSENFQDTKQDSAKNNESTNAEDKISISEKLKEKAKELAGKAAPETNLEEEYKAKIADLEDRMMRIAAEGENIKRRAAQDMEKARNFSIESFAKDLTPVLENLFRASESISDEDIKSDEKLRSTKEGVELTKGELLKAFEKHGIKRVYPTGEAFDHNLHQAMSQIEDNEKPSNTVIEVIQAGYTIKGRLINPALVIVSKKNE